MADLTQADSDGRAAQDAATRARWLARTGLEPIILWEDELPAPDAADEE